MQIFLLFVVSLSLSCVFTYRMLQTALQPPSRRGVSAGVQEEEGGPLQLLLCCCDFAWGALPSPGGVPSLGRLGVSGEEGLAAALEVLERGNLAVRCCLEALHAVLQEKKEKQQQLQAVLPEDLLVVAEGWRRDSLPSVAQQFGVYLQLLAEKSLIETTCDIFNTQLLLQQQQQRQQQQQQETVSFQPLTPQAVAFHLHRVLLRLLLNWVKTAENEGEALVALDVAMHAEALLPYLDSLISTNSEQTNLLINDNLKEAAKLVRALVLNACRSRNPLGLSGQQNQQAFQQQQASLCDVYRPTFNTPSLAPHGLA